MICALSLSFVLATAAVAQQQPEPRPPPPPEQNAQSAGARRLTLQDAVRIALERNPDLQRQLLVTLSAEQDRIVARSAILPSLTFNASAAEARTAGQIQLVPGVFQQVSGTEANYSVGATLRQLVFDGGKWWNNISAANLAFASQQATTDEQRLQVTYLVEQRFYEMIRSQRQLQVLTDAATRSRDQADFVQRLYEGGRSTQADVYAARANRDNDEIQRLGAERAVELARADLAVAIGLDPTEPLNIQEPQHMFDDPAQPPPAGDAVARALRDRPSLRAAQLTVASNRKLASAQRGDYWPTISLQGNFNRATQDIGQTFAESPGRNSTISGSVVLSWNVFNGFATQANATKADIQAAISENDFMNARRNVASDVEKAVAQLATARQQSRVAISTEQNAQENLRLARARQQVGVGTQLEVRDAELKLTQAQLSNVGAHIDGREAEAALRRAQGG